MLFLSIRPEYVEMILSGRKTVELRRLRPRCVPGDWIAIYSTTPERCLRGVAQVSEVTASDSRELWEKVRPSAGVSRVEYETYFAGAKQAVGIVLANPKRLVSPVSLTELRCVWPEFQPPQSFRYLDREQIDFVLSRLNERCRAA